MKTSIEISYYHLNENYKTPIKSFIEALQKNKNITVKPNSLSTHIFGEFDEVMSTLTDCIKEAFELPESIFILKVINMDREK
jgi:uncharacterized protein YqgV (UPF0045/DUF77 family)